MNKKQDKNNIEDIIDLTSTQKGILFHYISDSNSSDYHEQLSLTLIGDVKFQALESAWNFVIETNEMLRTIHIWENIKKPVQIILKKYVVDIDYVDFSLLDDHKIQLELGKIKENDIKKRIDITSEILRITLCKLGENKYEMMISNHHISYDGWSNGIILKELLNAYNYYYNRQCPPQIHKTKFKDFIKEIKKNDKLEGISFWQEHLSEIKNSNEFFSSTSKNKNFRRYKCTISEDIHNKIKLFSVQNKVSLASIFYSVWTLILQKLNDDDDIIFGTVVSGRNVNIKGIEDVVGMFINTIPLRVSVNSSKYISELIREIDNLLKGRNGYENIPLVEIKETCRSIESKNLFNSIVIVENYPVTFNNREDILKVNKYSILENTNYNMSISIMNFEEMELYFNYNEYVINDEMVKRIGGYFQTILGIIAKNKNICIEDIEMLSKDEKKQMLYMFNDTNQEYSRDKTLHEMFEEQVKHTPNNIAAVFEEEKITYTELNGKANILARYLIKMGVKSDTVVGIMVDRSIGMLIAILGVLKSGGAYLPIDTEYPLDRIKYMLEDSNAQILIIQKKLMKAIDFNKSIIELDVLLESSLQAENLQNMNKSTDLAYLIYTSGSTGKPKGVMVEHRQVINLIEGINKKTNIANYKNIVCLTAISFDIFVLETILPLTKGIKVVIANSTEQVDGNKLSELILKNNIEIMQSTPSRIQLLMGYMNFRRAISNLKIILVGGETLTQKVLESMIDYKKMKIYNVYGPTETTVWSTIKELNYISELNIGKPIQNTKVFILDKHNRLQPIGVPGELAISGEGVSRGYLNSPELTREKFMESNFFKEERIYKTGDLAKWSNDGNLIFIGRLDYQVKIRGFRIELGEIESKLLEHEYVNNVIVVTREDEKNGEYICAYVVGSDKLSVKELREYLSKHLPSYMIPSYFVQLENIPVTLNGKIDRMALPNPQEEILTYSVYESAKTEIEQKLVEIWRGVLGIEKIGLRDNFFGLGGHSLKAITLMGRIHKEFNIEMPITEIFIKPTIKELSIYIEETQKTNFISIPKAKENQYYPISYGQKRLFFLNQLKALDLSYNMPIIMIVEGNLHISKLENAYNKVAERHEILRTSFKFKNGEPVQIIHRNCMCKINIIKDYKGDIKDIGKHFIEPFDLSLAPLIRMSYISTIDKKAALLIDMHHIISDGVSMKILMNDIAEFYKGNNLNSLEIQYKDFSVWEKDYANTKYSEKAEMYWKEKVRDFQYTVIPKNYYYDSDKMGGSNVKIYFSKNEYMNIDKFCTNNSITKFAYFISILNIILMNEINQEDITIGIPVSGRTHVQLENLIGLFINIILVRTNIDTNQTYKEYVKLVNGTLINALNYQEYPYDQVYEMISGQNENKLKQLFSVMLNYMTYDEENENIQLDFGDATLTMQNDLHADPKHDITFYVNEYKDNIVINIVYRNNIKAKIIERISKAYVYISDKILNNKMITIKEIDYFEVMNRNDNIADEFLYNEEFFFD